jgi:hypothetical protein
MTVFSRTLTDPNSPIVRAALAERAKNIVRYWEPLHRLGFGVADEHGEFVHDPSRAATTAALELQRPHVPRFTMDRRRGFFTHSVVGNALLLLTVASHDRIPSLEITAADIIRQPNRHYLTNASAVDLGSLVIIRHGMTEANRRGIALGRSDGAEGWRGVVIDHAPREPPTGVVAWHCSSLLRTRQTAKIFGVSNAVQHSTLDEMDIGAAEGVLETTVVQTFHAAHLMYVRGDPFAAIVNESDLDNPRPAGECFIALLLRTAHCLEHEILQR